MADSNEFTLDDLMEQEGGATEQEDQGLNLGITPNQGTTQGPQTQRLAKLRQQYQELNQKIMHALDNNYAGYQLDTDQNGQKYYGNKSHAAYERDKMALQTLREQIDDLKDSIREDTQAAQRSNKSAAQMAREVFKTKISFVNKNIRNDVRRRYEAQVRGVDWGGPQLRNDDAKHGLLLMLFNHARGEAEEERAKKLRQQESDPNPDYIDASDDDDRDDSEPKSERNEYGHEKGTPAWEISERFKSRRNQNRVLGQRDSGGEG